MGGSPFHVAATSEAAGAHVRLVTERLALVNRQLGHARHGLDRLVHQLADAAPPDDANASPEDEPSSKEPSDAAILLSLPGVGTKVLSTLPAEGSDAVRRRAYGPFRCLCGLAPVARRSGKSMILTRRQAAHERCVTPPTTGPASPPNASRSATTGTRSLRARGHGHARALRSAADRLLKVACGMLRDRACFASHRVGSAQLHEVTPQRVAPGVRTGRAG